MRIQIIGFNFLDDYKRYLNLICMSFIVSLCFGIVFTKFGPFLSFGALCLLLLVYLFIVKFEVMFLVFIFIRPVLDQEQVQEFVISSFNVASVLSMLFIVAALFFILRQKKRINLPLEVKFYLIFFIFAAISTVGNFNIVKLGGLATFFRVASTLFVILIILQEFNTPEKIKKIFNTLMCSLIVPVFLGFLQIFHVIEPRFGRGRIDGGLSHPNTFAEYLAFFIIMIYAVLMLKDKINFRNRQLLWIVELVLVICLLLTYSRGPLLAIGITLLVITLFYVKKKVVLFFCVFGVILIIICLYTSGLPIFTSVFERFEDVNVWESGKVLKTNENSLGWRVLHWQALLKQASNSPIVGYGLGSIENIGDQRMAAHNNYIHIFFETGLGVCFFYSSIFMVLKRAIIGARMVGNQYKFLYVGGIGIILFYLIQSFSEHFIRNTAIQICFLSFLTIIICSQQHAIHKGLKEWN